MLCTAKRCCCVLSVQNIIYHWQFTLMWNFGFQLKYEFSEKWCFGRSTLSGPNANAECISEVFLGTRARQTFSWPSKRVCTRRLCLNLILHSVITVFKRPSNLPKISALEQGVHSVSPKVLQNWSAKCVLCTTAVHFEKKWVSMVLKGLKLISRLLLCISVFSILAQPCL